MKNAQIFLILFIILFLPSLAFAESENPNSNNGQENVSRQNVIKQEFEKNKEAEKAKIASRSALRQDKLDSKKLQVCQTQQANIVRRSQSLTDRAQSQETNFEQIAARVDEFYTTRLAAQNVNVASYSALKNNITTKEQDVNLKLAIAKDDANNFSCSSNDPKGQLTNFRADMQAVITALKDFRTSIKDFIVAIRTAYNNANPVASQSAKESE